MTVQDFKIPESNYCLQYSIYNMESSFAVKVFATKLLIINDVEKAAKLLFDSAQGEFDKDSADKKSTIKFWENVITELTLLDEDYSIKVASSYLILVMDLFAKWGEP